MKLHSDLEGNIILEISRDEIRNAGLSATLNKWINEQVDEAAKTVSDSKALEYLNAIGDTSGRPITELVLPSTVIEFKDKEYLDDDNDCNESFEDGHWYCSHCGSPNTVSQDEGCTNCEH